MKRPILFIVATTLAGCGPTGDRVFEVSESRVVERDLQLGKSVVDRFSSDESHAAHSNQAAEPDPGRIQFEWKLPDGWKEKPLTQYRDGSFASPGGGDCSISRASGGVLLNVNRWRGQFGMPPLTQADIEKLPRHPLFARAQALVVECSGDYVGMMGQSQKDAKLLGLVLPIKQDLLLFLKFTGAAAEVDAQRDNFFALADSLTLARSSGDASQGRGAEPEPSVDQKSLAWDIPADWQQVPSRSSARLITMSPKSSEDVQCWLIVFPGQAGSLRDNVNRWRGEVKAELLDDAGIEALPTLSVLGKDATLVEAYGDYAGQSGQVEAAGLLGLICYVGSESVFVKMVGPAELVRAEKGNFVTFCRSLRVSR